MSYDPCPEHALSRIIKNAHLNIGTAYAIAGHKEHELKLGHAPKNVVALRESASLKQSQTAFWDLMGTFNTASQQSTPVYFDPEGLAPNNYVLVSLGLETVKTLPTAEFFLNDMQFRMRFPVHAHSNDPKKPLISEDQLDANLKGLLSKTDPNDHRIERELSISNPSRTLTEFKKLEGLPDFIYDIDDNHLMVSEICMTARTGFFLLAKVPNEDVHILLHGCYDVSKFTTPSMDVYTNRNPRVEMELEAKFVIGNDPSLASETVQFQHIQSLFVHIRAKAIPHGFKQMTESKMETAANLRHDFYLQHVGDGDHLSPFSSSLARRLGDKNGLSPTLYHALSLRQSIGGVFESVALHGRNAPLVRLTSGLPNPERLLGGNDLYEQHLAVA